MRTCCTAVGVSLDPHAAQHSNAKSVVTFFTSLRPLHEGRASAPFMPGNFQEQSAIPGDRYTVGDGRTPNPDYARSDNVTVGDVGLVSEILAPQRNIPLLTAGGPSNAGIQQ